ncbi:MAG TPA: class I SAM-dependent methyltransferase [Geminicoccaceae bacterium]|nr:class I SAM-dependent methyltransferase [Geminicoccaceae bacterium]
MPAALPEDSTTGGRPRRRKTISRAKKPETHYVGASTAEDCRLCSRQRGVPMEARAARLKVGTADTSVRKLSARLEPFDSYWQAPDDVEGGYASFAAYYRVNYLPRLPADRSSRVLVISCGPGYLVKALIEAGYSRVQGIDSDASKVRHASRRGLPCATAEAFPYLEAASAEFDVIVAEQELNHLTNSESVEFLRLCRAKLRPGAASSSTPSTAPTP